MKKLGINDPKAEVLLSRHSLALLLTEVSEENFFAEYSKMLRNKLDSDLSPNCFNEILTSHFINPEFLNTDHWESFVKERREKLLELVLSACSGNVSPFSF